MPPQQAKSRSAHEFKQWPDSSQCLLILNTDEQRRAFIKGVTKKTSEHFPESVVNCTKAEKYVYRVQFSVKERWRCERKGWRQRCTCSILSDGQQAENDSNSIYTFTPSQNECL